MAMSYVNYNANPISRRGDDCTVRAISKVLGKSWEVIYMDLCVEGLLKYDVPSANHVWGAYLRKKGYRREVCAEDCTVADFASQHAKGRYILALYSHVVALIDGDYYDTWDSGEQLVKYYWQKGTNNVRI